MSKLYYILNAPKAPRGEDGLRLPLSELALWWGPDCRGYTQDVDKAGVYTEEEAMHLVRNRPHEDEAIEVSVVLGAARRYVHRDALVQLPRLQVAKDGA